MQQISPPLRIALGAVLFFALIWFVALRPKGAAEEPKSVTAPGVTGLAGAVADARGATEAASAAASRSEQAAANVGEQAAGSENGAAKSGNKAGSKTSSKTATKTSSKTAKAGTTKVLSGAAARADARKLVAALNRGQAVVLLFRNNSSDSDHVARVVRGLDRRGGRVVTRVVSISQLGNYGVFTDKTTVSEPPTTFVIGNKRRAKLIVGYTSTTEVDQAVGDVLSKRSGRDRFGKGRGRGSKSR